MDKPYECPHSRPRDSGPMPLSVIVAVTVLMALLIPQAVGFALGVDSRITWRPVAFMSIGWQLLVLVGILARSRLAWRWGRILTCTVATLSMLCTAILLMPIARAQRPQSLVVWTTFVTIALYTVYSALGHRRAKVYFRLVCPRCGTVTNRSADFLFKRAMCKSCGSRW